VLAALLVHCGDSNSSETTSSPAIALSAATPIFSAAAGGPNPPFQSVAVANGGGGTLSGLSASVTYTPGQPTGWLTAMMTGTTVPSVVYLAPAPGSLSAGTYTAAVGVASGVASNSPQAVNVTFTVAPCTPLPPLAPGGYSAIDPVFTLGCLGLPPNGSGTDSAEYLLVPQATTDVPDLSQAFWLRGGAAASVAPLVSAAHQPAPASLAVQFHNHLRELERTRAYSTISGMRVAPRQGARAAAPMDTVGNRRTFKVLSSLSFLQLTNVGAIARSVGDHIVLYVDSMAPPGGLSPGDFDKMRWDFDTLLYAVDTAAFGRESDIDSNGRVIVLMTNVVNRLVTGQQCQTSGYVAGFFFGADIDPQFAAQFNGGEVFYSIVADPNGTLSCGHFNSAVNRIIPVTFIHEFQHMISFNQHVLVRGGAPEVLWLNEGLSHYAEERGGQAFLQGGDNVRYCDHVIDDLYDFGLYLTNPGGYALVNESGIGGLAERGAAWAFVRYLVDQFAADTGLAAADAFTRQVEQTFSTGTANVAQVTGTPFATLARRWALANWVSDLPGFTAPAELKYTHWAFRTAFPALRLSCNSMLLPPTFPLAASAGPGASISVSGSMHSGSAGAYHRALQGPSGGGFSVSFGDAAGVQLRGTVRPRLNVIRIR
jgi:hypothetical protein